MAIQSDLYRHQNAAGNKLMLYGAGIMVLLIFAELRLVTVRVRSSDVTDFITLDCVMVIKQDLPSASLARLRQVALSRRRPNNATR
jgi:hypothetical protein